MKKKLLSLVLAGAMVASTSVSAFAASKNGEGQDVISPTTTPTTPIAVPNGEITGEDNKEYTTDVTVQGSVASDSGALPSTTFNVTIPTKAAFTVNKDGVLEGTPIKVSNKGTQKIDVYAYKFVDTTGEDKIKVDSESSVKVKNRSNVNLTIGGKLKVLHLKSEQTNATDKNGLYTDKELNHEAQGDSLKLTSLAPGESEDLKLQGSAGKNNADLDQNIKSNGLSDEFTLTLKIKKATTN